MKCKFWLMALLAAVLLNAGTAWADSEFYVIASGSGMGTKITSLPYEIKTSGFYFLAGDLTYNGSGNAITVSADNVTLDLMGFNLIYTGGVGGYGIRMSGLANVEIRNGTVRGGFLYAIYEDNPAIGTQHRVINVRAKANSGGIWLCGKNHLVKNCSALNNGMNGIYIDSGLVADSISCNNSQGILVHGPGSALGNIANNNTVYNFNLGTGGATNILVDRNSASGLATNYFIASGTSGVVITAANVGTP
jgi:hypothetical protein